jgi:hypothetical protein
MQDKNLHVVGRAALLRRQIVQGRTAACSLHSSLKADKALSGEYAAFLIERGFSAVGAASM